MRIAIAGFLHESNTFNPLRTDRAAFEAQSLTFGPALLDEWRDAHHEVGGFIQAARMEGYEPVPIIMATATPAGPVADAILMKSPQASSNRSSERNRRACCSPLHGDGRRPSRCGR